MDLKIEYSNNSISFPYTLEIDLILLCPLSNSCNNKPHKNVNEEKFKSWFKEKKP